MFKNIVLYCVLKFYNSVTLFILHCISSVYVEALL